jgi:D-amino peptidase
MVAGHHGVPVVFVSGDAVFAEEARSFFPGVEAVAVKEAIGYTAAKTLHPLVARERIAAGVKAGLGRRQQIRPIKISSPVTLEIELSRASYADAAMFVPGMRRVNGSTVSYVAPDGVAAYKMSRLISSLARD